jgi:hypothetical protein
MTTTPIMNQTLKNGARVLRVRRTDDRCVILAHRPTETYHPFVTWRVDRNGDCFWGHYYATRDFAEADFATRFVE